ncbi:MAG TPA: alpha/beta hydrolase fold domain-containing protein [Acidimicrobiales bacterium]|nr:alpha/beta hydrolase fold domain-containing protein [Acidimicrobiales bacterium]
MILPSSGAEPHGAVHRVADLQLRGRAGPLRCRVHWPAPTGRAAAPALLVYLPPGGPDLDDAGDGVGRSMCALAGVVVLAASHRPLAGPPVLPTAATAEDGTTATQWAADHAAELGADSGRLVVGGAGPGGGVAAAVARLARDEEWPPLMRQLLIHPVLGTRVAPDGPAGPSLAGVAPATVLRYTHGPGADDTRRYVDGLRQAGVEVDEHRDDGPLDCALPGLAQALRTALAAEGTTHDG